MLTLYPGRRQKAIAVSVVLSAVLICAVTPRALAGAELRKCLMDEADRLFSRLATAIGTSEIDPAKIDDAFIGRESAPLPGKCTKETGQSDAADLAAFRGHMAKWSYHLDRKLSEINAKGTPD